MTLPTVGPTDQDEYNLWAFLLGGAPVENGRDPALADFPQFNVGLLRRLVMNTPGDPIGPAQRFNPVPAATQLTVPDRAVAAALTVEAQAIRYRVDGTLPTATVGTPLAVGSSILLTGRATMTSFKFIEQVAGTVVNVDYYT